MSQKVGQRASWPCELASSSLRAHAQSNDNQECERLLSSRARNSSAFQVRSSFGIRDACACWQRLMCRGCAVAGATEVAGRHLLDGSLLSSRPQDLIARIIITTAILVGRNSGPVEELCSRGSQTRTSQAGMLPCSSCPPPWSNSAPVEGLCSRGIQTRTSQAGTLPCISRSYIRLRLCSTQGAPHQCGRG